MDPGNESENAPDPMRLNPEFDSNEINASDLHPVKYNDPDSVRVNLGPICSSLSLIPCIAGPFISKSLSLQLASQVEGNRGGGRGGETRSEGRDGRERQPAKPVTEGHGEWGKGMTKVAMEGEGKEGEMRRPTMHGREGEGG
jgi:hypothetical protein